MLVTTVLDMSLRRRDPALDAKWQVFLEQKDDVDVLFMGSSRVYRGVVPEVFDRELARLGRPLRSFNLGLVGMRPHETDELLRRVLDSEPARLRWVFVELADWVPMRRNPFSGRAVGWHDGSETLSALGSVWLQDAGLSLKLSDTRTQLMAFGCRLLALGVGAEALRACWGGLVGSTAEQASDWAEVFRRDRGYGRFTAEEHASGLTGAHRTEFLHGLQAFADQVGTLPELNAAPRSTRFYHLAALQQQIARVEASGAQAIPLIMPSYEAVPVLHRLADAGLVPRLMAFDDPLTQPAFYRIERHFDLRHLNHNGAVEFSTLLAQRFAELLGGDE